MPELPEVETMRRGVACIAGSTIERVEYVRSKLHPLQIRPSLKTLQKRARGRTIRSVGRVGKRVVLELDSGERIVIEPRMTGRVLLADPPNRTHLRLAFHLSGGPSSRLLFWDSRGLGVVHLLSPEQFAVALGPERLGPDALDISLEMFRQRLSGSRRATGALDQQLLAGLATLRLGDAPSCPGASRIGLQRPSTGPMATAPCGHGEVLDEAICHQGSTLADGTYRNAQNEAGGFQALHRVYQRTGQPCSVPRRPIVRIVQAQRSTFYCPACQRRP